MTDKEYLTRQALIEAFKLARELLGELPYEPRFQLAWEHITQAQAWLENTLEQPTNG